MKAQTMKKKTPLIIPDCNICHKKGWIIVKKENGERVARQCECRKEEPKQNDFNNMVQEATNNF